MYWQYRKFYDKIRLYTLLHCSRGKLEFQDLPLFWVHAEKYTSPMSYCDMKWNLPIRGLGYLSHLHSVSSNQSHASPELLTYWFLSHCNTLASKILFPKFRILPKGPWTSVVFLSTIPEGLHGSCLYLLYFDQIYPPF